jgi:DNA-binding LacI/PurR family transcriptional regulator
LANINDIARLAGVSKATVSNVFTKKKKVSKESMKKVYEASKTLNYKPNFLASSLVTKTTNIIGIFLRYAEPPISSNTFETYSQLYGSIIIGFSVKAAEFNLKPLIYISIDETNDFSDLLLTQSEPIDGALVMTPHLQDVRIDELIEAEVPFVLVGQPGTRSANVPRIDADNFKIVFDMTEKLIRLGHRNIALINSSPDFTITYDRLNGYRKALETYGIPFNDALSYQIDSTIEAGEQAAKCLIASKEPFTAAIMQSTLTCAAFYDIFQKHGLRVPEDVSVISLGGDPTPYKLKPTPSLILIDYFEIGSRAAQIIYDRLNNNLIHCEEYVDYRFVEGKSVRSLL